MSLDNFLIISMIISLIIIFIVYYLSKKEHAEKLSRKINLSTLDNELSNEYSTKLVHDYTFNMSNDSIARILLQSLFTNIDTTNIIIGENLNQQYYNITEMNLPIVYTTDSLIYDEYIIDLRSIIGYSGEIAIISNELVREQLKRNNNLDLSIVNSYINSGIHKQISDYIQSTLKHRWKLINKLNDSRIMNSSGSYLYYNNDDTNIIFNNVEGLLTERGIRINLLCSDENFDILMRNWKLIVY